MDQTNANLQRIRALDWDRDTNPNHWRTINGSHVHLDKNGNYDGGAGNKFNGRHHYGPNWKQKASLMESLTNALRKGVAGKQKNVAPQGTSSSGKIKTEEEKAREEIKGLKQKMHNSHAEFKKAQREYNQYRRPLNPGDVGYDQYQKVLNKFNTTLREYQNSRTKLQETIVKKAASGVDLTHPDSIASVGRGAPMDEKQANSGHANPGYRRRGGYTINCQTCVVAYELRKRGYNVEAKPNTKSNAFEELSLNTNHAWIDPKTGTYPEYIKDESVTGAKKAYKWINNILEPGKRYTIQFGWAGRKRTGHIIHCRKIEGGIELYDPQSGRIISEQQECLMYLDRIKYKMTSYGHRFKTPPKVLQVDGLIPNVDLLDKVLTKGGGLV